MKGMDDCIFGEDKCPLDLQCGETNRCLAKEFKDAGFRVVEVWLEGKDRPDNFWKNQVVEGIESAIPTEPPLTDAELVKLRRHMALWPE